MYVHDKQTKNKRYLFTGFVHSVILSHKSIVDNNTFLVACSLHSPHYLHFADLKYYNFENRRHECHYKLTFHDWDRLYYPLGVSLSELDYAKLRLVYSVIRPTTGQTIDR